MVLKKKKDQKNSKTELWCREVICHIHDDRCLIHDKLISSINTKILLVIFFDWMLMKRTGVSLPVKLSYAKDPYKTIGLLSPFIWSLLYPSYTPCTTPSKCSHNKQIICCFIYKKELPLCLYFYIFFITLTCSKRCIIVHETNDK